MSLWFLLWFVLSFILLGATFWSTIILLQQKKAWGDYAVKKGLIFTRGTFFGPTSVEGTINGYGVSLFTATQQKEEARQNRQLSVVQINANNRFLDGIGCGTVEMLPFLKSLDGISPHEVKTEKWDKAHYMMTRNKKAVDAYLSEERANILTSILNMPNADILILLDGNEGVIRIETANPLKNAAQIDKIVNNLMAAFKKLTPDEEEIANLKSLYDDDEVKVAEAPVVEDKTEIAAPEVAPPQETPEA